MTSSVWGMTICSLLRMFPRTAFATSGRLDPKSTEICGEYSNKFDLDRELKISANLGDCDHLFCTNCFCSYESAEISSGHLSVYIPTLGVTMIRLESRSSPISVNQIRRLLPLCFLSILLFLIVSATSVSAQQTGPLDVRACFSSILVDVTVNKQDTNVRYAIQQQWSRDLYETAKRSNTLSGWIDGVEVSDSYEATNTKRLQEMYKMKADYNYSSNSALYHAALNPQAKSIITKCLDSLGATRGIGLYWVPWVHTEDPTLIDLEFRFQYKPLDKPLHVSTKRIDNAVVEDDDGKHPSELFGWTISHPFYYNVVMPYESRFLTLRRKSPGDVITINVTTDPNLNVPPITIEGEPQPEDCAPFANTKNAFDQPLHADVKAILVDEDRWLMKDAQGHPIPEGNGVSFRVAYDLPDLYPKDEDFTNAQITNVYCERTGSPVDFMDWTYNKSCCAAGETGTAEGLTAICRGWWQDRGRHINMSIDWQRLGFKCTSHEWKKENGTWK